MKAWAAVVFLGMKESESRDTLDVENQISTETKLSLKEENNVKIIDCFFFVVIKQIQVSYLIGHDSAVLPAFHHHHLVQVSRNSIKVNFIDITTKGILHCKV